MNKETVVWKNCFVLTKLFLELIKKLTKKLKLKLTKIFVLSKFDWFNCISSQYIGLNKASITETLERAIRDYIVLYAMETWEESITSISYDDGDILASHRKSRKMRRTNCHTLPVKFTIARKIPRICKR